MFQRSKGATSLKILGRRPQSSTPLARYRRNTMRRQQTWVAKRAEATQSEVSQIEHGKLPEVFRREKWAIAYGFYKTVGTETTADVERFEAMVCEGRDGWDLPLFRFAIVENGALDVIQMPLPVALKQKVG